MSPQEPTISVIVPVYKVEAYLPRCIDSLLAQTYKDFELILVDDGSPDRCGAICDRYAGRDPRICVIHKQNGGLSDARNAGLKIARGRYLAFVDSDDWVAPEYLHKLLQACLDTQADICECNIIHTSGTPSAVPAQDASAETCSAQDALAQLIADGTFRQHVWNKLYSRRVVDGILFPRGKLNEDEFWTYQVFGNASKVAKIQDALYFYFQRPDSIMGARYSLRRLDALEAKEARQRYLELHFPALSSAARVNLHQSAIYSGQMVLLHLNHQERAQAAALIRKFLTAHPLSKGDLANLPAKAKIWLWAAKISFWGTCRIKNLLKKGF